MRGGTVTNDGLTQVGSFVSPPEAPLAGVALRRVDSAPVYRIGEVADRIGLSMRSIRYYEETGLLTPAGRTSGGFRLYSEADVQRLLTIMQMKPLGFSLDEMRAVLADLDAMADADADADTREAAHDALRRTAEAVQARLEVLERQLGIAHAFRAQLEAQLAES